MLYGCAHFKYINVSKEANVAYETKRFVPRLRNTNTTNRKIQGKKRIEQDWSY